MLPPELHAQARVTPGCSWFRWWEMSGWEHADAVRIARARALVQNLLCPARQALGVLHVSRGGWYWSRHGYPRTGTHGEGAAVDLVPGEATIGELYRWLRDHTLYGELIWEDDHVHVTLPGHGGVQEALIQQADGSLTLDPDAPTVLELWGRARPGTLGATLLAAGAAWGLWSLHGMYRDDDS